MNRDRGRLDRYVLPLLGPGTKASTVRAADARNLIDRLGRKRLGGPAVRVVLNAASSMFKYGVRSGQIDVNPLRLLERGERPSGKRRTEPRYLDADQIERLLRKLPVRYRPVAAVMAYAGLRVSEATALRWSHVDFKAGTLFVPGTKSKAAAAPVPLIPRLAEELQAHRRRQTAVGIGVALVFVGETGRALTPKVVRNAIYRAGDAAGLNPEGAERVGCHDLRHSCAGLLFHSGASAPTVAAVLRHSTPQVTLTYYAGLSESGRDALRADLEAAFK